MERVILDEEVITRQTDPRAPKPTEAQAAEMIAADTREFEKWAKGRDITQTVFGTLRPAENGVVGFGFALLGSERWQVGIISQVVKRMSKVSRVALGARILLDVEKEGRPQG